MILTNELIHSVSTNGDAGWSREQLELLGVTWPPQRGWLKALIGTEIIDEKWLMVDKLRGVRRKKDRKLVMEYYEPILR